MTEDEREGIAKNDDGAIEDVEGVMPTDPTNENELIGGTDQDWKSMGDELAEFLAESDSDDSAASDSGGKDDKKRKRDLESGASTDAENSETDTPNADGSKLERKKKRAMHRVSSLTEVASLVERSSPSLADPDSTDPGRGAENGIHSGQTLEVQDDDDIAALEAEMEAELEKLDNLEGG